MSRSNQAIINYNFTPDTLRLVPEGEIKFPLTPKYSEDGALDFDDFLGQLLEGIEARMGRLKPIDQAGRSELKNQLAQNVIKHAINPINDILDDFDDDGSPYYGSDGQLHVPLRMKGSGYKLDLTIKYLADGSLDLDHLVESFESAYKYVLKGAM